jgi:peptide/nickel transport system substrate-binding protein
VSSKLGIVLLGFIAVHLAACAPAQAPARQRAEIVAGGERPAIQRTLVIGSRGQPPSLAARPIVSFSGSLAEPRTLFNATLDSPDERGVTYPLLAEALPELNTDSWKVFPDGAMETTYRLKPNLTWHDGQPLVAEDFAFAWEVYATPELGVSGSSPVAQLQEVAAVDPRTIRMRWRVPYPGASALGDGFAPLPRHLLDEPFRALDPSAFANHPFWAPEYIGLGPYRLTAIEPGASLEGEAFAGYVLGRPQIDRVQVRFLPDPNTAMANLLAGEVHYMGQYVLDASNGETLEAQWAAAGDTGSRGGQVFWAPVQPRIAFVQLRPEVVQPRSLLEVPVRRAMASGMDASSAVDALSGGRGLVSPSVTSPRVPFYAEIDRVIARYPYDPRRVQHYLESAGYQKGSDGVFVDGAGERLTVGVWTSSGAKNERQGQVLAAGLKQAGIDAAVNVIPAQQVATQSVRALSPGLHIETGPSINPYEQFVSTAIPTAENRWRGNNLGGWANADYDRLYEAFARTLNPSEQVQAIAAMERTLTEQVGAIPLFFDIVVTARTGNLAGPIARETPNSGQNYHRIEHWAWRS